MAIATTAAILGAAAFGGSIYNGVMARKANDASIERMKKQEAAARAAAALDSTRTDTGASVDLGRGQANAGSSTTTAAGQGAATTREGSVTARVGMDTMGTATKRRVARGVGL